MDDERDVLEETVKAGRNIRHRTARIEVTVTQQDIEKAKESQRDPFGCMISSAIKRQIDTARRVTTDLATIRFTDSDSGIRMIYLTPPTAQKALIDFDQGEKMVPFRFRLNKLAQVLPRTVRKASGQPRRPQKSKAAVSAHVPQKVGGKPIPNVALAHIPNRGIIRRYGVKSLKP